MLQTSTTERKRQGDMALKRAQAGGSESTEVFTSLVGSTVVMRIVSQDGKRPGQNGSYDVVTAHVLVIDGPRQWEFHKNLAITNAGITGCLVGEDVGDDIVATIGTYNSFGSAKVGANPASDAKYTEVEAMFAEGDPFEHYLSRGRLSNGMTTQPAQSVSSVTTGTKAPPPPWKTAKQ